MLETIIAKQIRMELFKSLRFHLFRFTFRWVFPPVSLLLGLCSLCAWLQGLEKRLFVGSLNSRPGPLTQRTIPHSKSFCQLFIVVVTNSHFSRLNGCIVVPKDIPIADVVEDLLAAEFHDKCNDEHIYIDTCDMCIAGCTGILPVHVWLIDYSLSIEMCRFNMIQHINLF